MKKRASEVGDRVGAILSVDEDAKIIKFLGYGIYEGRFPVEGLGDLIEGMTGEKASPEDMLNPRIKLDSGQIVWGYQMWWGPESVIKEQLDYLLGAQTVTATDILPLAQPRYLRDAVRVSDASLVREVLSPFVSGGFKIENVAMNSDAYL